MDLVTNLCKTVIDYINIDYSTDLFKDEVKLEKKRLEAMRMLYPIFKRWSKLSENERYDALTTLYKALQWSWGKQAYFDTEVDKLKLYGPNERYLEIIFG